MRNLLKLASAMVALGLSSVTAHATAITVDSGWVPFSFGAVGSGASGQPFTFSSAGTTTLTVTDAFLSGDRFEVFNFASSLGLTSAPTSSGVDIFSNPDGALLDPQWSSGSWVLGAGSYSITITTVASPFGGGGAYLRVDSGGTVPDGSSTFVLALIGLVAALKARRFMAA